MVTAVELLSRAMVILQVEKLQKHWVDKSSHEAVAGANTGVETHQTLAPSSDAAVVAEKKGKHETAEHVGDDHTGLASQHSPTDDK